MMKNAIKDLLEDALVLLDNANFSLNSWRQKRFAEFLTEVGKRTLRDCIPADKYLFPDKFISNPPLQNASSNNPTEGISPFIQITAPLTTAALEENENADVAQNLTTNFPSVIKQKNLSPSSLVPDPVPANYLLLVLETVIHSTAN